MNENDLNQLLNKYYRGETSLDEERLLRNELNDNSVDASLLQALNKLDSEVEIPADLGEMLSNNIDQWADEEQQKTKVAPSIWRGSRWWAAAASVAVVVAAGFWFMRDKSPEVGQKEPPVIAKIDKAPETDITNPVPEIVDKIPQQNQPQVSVSKIKSASSLMNNRVHLAQSRVKQSAEQEISADDEEMALAALEKFSTVLNKGTTRLNEAGEIIDEINNTVKQHLYID